MMGWLLRSRIRIFAAGALASLFSAVLVLALVASSGVYNIAASAGHWRIVEAFLRFGMIQSVQVRALTVPPPPPLDNTDLIALGAGHFHGGCAYCHGAPGIAINPIAENMLPPPPELSHAAKEWKDRELFWIVKHGIKYTGMPSWVSQQRDDEVWAVVAFLKQLPGLDANGYRDLALGGLQVPQQSGREIALTEGASEAVSACARCHGAGNSRPRSNLVPMLHGQTAEFIVAALETYAKGKRESGVMQPVALDLSGEAAKRVARYYAQSVAPRTIAPSADRASIERGRVLAAEGDGAGKIPACGSCHGDNALSLYPRLAGQNAAYMINRLRLWKQGLRSETDADAIMAPIARALDEQQINDVSAYFAAQSPSRARPARAQ